MLGSDRVWLVGDVIYIDATLLGSGYQVLMGVARLEEDGKLHVRDTDGRHTEVEVGAACPRTFAKDRLRFLTGTRWRGPDHRQ